MDEKRKQPAFLVAILALLGAASFPKVLLTQGGGTPPPRQEKAVAAPLSATFVEDEVKDPDRRNLKPLLDYLSEGGAVSGDAKDLDGYLAEKLPVIAGGGRKDPSVHCLVITLPDPVASVAGAHFDELLDIVQRAVELQGFILDRSQLPWRPTTPGSASAPDRLTRIRPGGVGLELRMESTSPPEPKHDRPGLIVFKQAFPAQGEDPTVLLVFIVPESPILGIEKTAFTESLKLIDRRFYGYLTKEPAKAQQVNRKGAGNCDDKPTGPRRIVHIVAPCFTSSQRSLEVAIGSWKHPEDRAYHLRIISNNAGQMDRERLEKCSGHASGCRVSFRSMVHETSLVAAEMVAYLREELGYDTHHVALLIESNSGLVQALAEHVWRKDLADEFIFPLQVSEVRKAYEKEGLLNSGKFDAAGAPERLTIPPDESGVPRDMPRSFTPASSAAFDEMALNQVLTTIGHRRYNAVGIIATNPLDVAFLARRVRRFCPNVRLFAIQADLLFARPENVADLRGLLIASTYSLYPANQWIITPYGATPRVLFNNQAGQGLYNAIAAHLWEMGLVRSVDGSSPDSPPLLEFGMPYGPRAQADRPPIWIGAVGERGIYPVASVVPEAYDLRLMPSVKDADVIPAAGKDLIIVAAVNRTLHFRIFDADGKLVVDVDETRLKGQSPKIEDLRKIIDGRRSPCELTRSERHRVIAAVTSIVGCDPRKDRHYLYDPTTVPDEPRSACRPPPDLEGESQRLKAMKPNPHLLYWFVCLFLFFACFAIAGLTWVYVHWSVDRGTNRLKPIVARLGFGHLLRELNCEFAPRGYAGPPYDPQARFRVPKGKPCSYPPPLGAGIYLVLINLSALVLSYYVFSYFLVAMMPYIGKMSNFIYLAYVICMSSIAAISASFVLATLEVIGARTLLRRRYFVFSLVIIAVIAGWSLCLLYSWDNGAVPAWRLDFERITNLPSGVSPLFPVLFLAGAIASWIHSQLARRRLYRLLYLPAIAPDDVAQDEGSQPEKGLHELRKARQAVDCLITKPAHSIGQVSFLLRWGLVLSFVLLLIRRGTRGMPRSFESYWFDHVFWILFFLLIVSVVIHTLQLLALWSKIRAMLQLAISLPMAHAFDRIPQRLKGWFFGAEEIRLRKELVLQQGAALLARSTPELAEVFQKAFPASQGYWHWEMDRLRRALAGQDGTLDSTRAVYPLLDPLWESIPVEEIRPQRPRSAEKQGDVERAGAWSLMPQYHYRLDRDEHRMLSDWARVADDLVALQIVRWFGPASSQLLPIMRFLVLGSLLLLLAITSYPFDHAGWLMTVMVTLILFVAWAIGIVLTGTNRDELISRVSDTTPGRFSFDSGFVGSLLTMIGPLLAALLAISFDLSDLLHTWFGPIFQLL
jgi:hypothetical protein